jgi:hypothetical protein
MAKGKNAAAPVVAPVAAPVVAAVAAPVTLYLPTAKGLNKYKGQGNTTNGNGGTAGTWAACVALFTANPNGVTLAQVKEVCVANADAGFALYALNRLKLYAPVVAATPATPAA